MAGRKKTTGKDEPKRKPGRPSGYRPEFDAQAAKLCRLGATDRDIADFFGVSEQTINAWKLRNPSFLEALTRSKDEFDSQVERSLFQRALGYSHKAVKMFQAGGEVISKDYTEHYPPDTTACIFWLKNRQKDKWRDKPDDDGDDTTPTPVKVTVEVKDARRPGGGDE
jgi:hypothetical protein